MNWKLGIRKVGVMSWRKEKGRLFSRVEVERCRVFSWRKENGIVDSVWFLFNAESQRAQRLFGRAAKAWPPNS